jgi:hypothetical protein
MQLIVKDQRYNSQEFGRFFEINLLYCTVHTSGKNQHIILSQLRLAQSLVSAIPPYWKNMACKKTKLKCLAFLQQDHLLKSDKKNLLLIKIFSFWYL